MNQRTLVILRHAKSAWPPGVPDHERPLAERGRRDAPAAGRWVGEHVGAPDAVVVSTALRTRQTWELAAPGTGFRGTAAFDGRVYEATVEELVDVARGLPDQARIAVLVGHNPGCESLARALAGTGEPAAWDRLDSKYPTAGVAVLALPGTWADLATGTGHLLDFAVPRG